MKVAIITLKDGRKFEYENEYIWGYSSELNDNRTPFIEIGSYVFRKDEISTIEVYEKTSMIKEVEIETNDEGEKEDGIN